MHTIHADDRSLALTRQAGFDWVVQVFAWRDVEPVQGEYQWETFDLSVSAAEYYGLNLVVRVDHPPAWATDSTALDAPPRRLSDYGDFLYTLASRYRGRVRAYIVWNEPNLAREWGDQPPDPQAYTALLQVAYRRLKQADPGALIVSAGLAPTNEQSPRALDDRLYLQKMYAAGAKDYFDILGAHPYGFAYPPDDPRGPQSLNVARLLDLRDIMVANGDADKEVWATELGWTTEERGEDAWLVVSPKQQAEYLVRIFEKAQQEWPWLTLVAVWNLNSRPSDLPGHPGFNILDTPAYTALQEMARRQAFAAPATPTPTPGRQRIVVLADDIVIHLGDSNLLYPWKPLYDSFIPSPTWRGAFYVREVGNRRWRLTLDIFQSNARWNRVTINGQPLAPPYLPVENHFDGIWIAASFRVPPGILRRGLNEIAITIGKNAPPLQYGDLVWDDLQFRNVALIEE